MRRVVGEVGGLVEKGVIDEVRMFGEEGVGKVRGGVVVFVFFL